MLKVFFSHKTPSASIKILLFWYRTGAVVWQNRYLWCQIKQYLGLRYPVWKLNCYFLILSIVQPCTAAVFFYVLKEQCAGGLALFVGMGKRNGWATAIRGEPSTRKPNIHLLDFLAIHFCVSCTISLCLKFLLQLPCLLICPTMHYCSIFSVQYCQSSLTVELTALGKRMR